MSELNCVTDFLLTGQWVDPEVILVNLGLPPIGDGEAERCVQRPEEGRDVWASLGPKLLRDNLCLHPELILTGASSFAANGDKKQIKVSIRVSSSSDKKNQEDEGNVSEALNKNPIFQD